MGDSLSYLDNLLLSLNKKVNKNYPVEKAVRNCDVKEDKDLRHLSKL